MRNCMGSEVGRQEDVTSQPLGGPSTSQLGATLRSVSISANPACRRLLPLPCQLRLGNVGKEERRTEWKDWRGSLRGLSSSCLRRGEEQGQLCPLGFGPFPEDLGWERVLLTRGWGAHLGCGRGETDLGRLRHTVGKTGHKF